MPKSKRSRVVALTKTDKRSTRDQKSKHIEEVRNAVDKHESLYLFSYENMRSTKFKDIRLHFRETSNKDPPSRIFLGKNKLLQVALGRTAEEEYADNLRHVAKRIVGGSVGLLFTSRPREEVEAYFANLVEPDYARAGAVASREVVVTSSNKDLENFPVSMMEQLRKLGMPVEIKNGKVVFRDGLTEYRICKQGDVLSADKCRLLVHFDFKLINFKVKLVCRWSDGAFAMLE